jgi:hypothetical protein
LAAQPEHSISGKDKKFFISGTAHSAQRTAHSAQNVSGSTHFICGEITVFFDKEKAT